MEMLSEVNLLRTRLEKCEKANRDLVNRFDSQPWRVSEQMKKSRQDFTKHLAGRNNKNEVPANKNLYRGCVTNHDEIIDSPRGGFGSNYETNQLASKVMKPQQTLTVLANLHNR